MWQAVWQVMCVASDVCGKGRVWQVMCVASDVCGK